MSYNTDYSSSNRILINSNAVGYEGAALSEEKKVDLEKQVIDELPLDQPIVQPTDIKVNYNSKKTFLRRRENSNDLSKDGNSPILSKEKVEFTDPGIEENKDKRHTIKDLKNEKRRRHFSEGASSIPQKNDRSHHRERKSMNLRSCTLKLDSSGSYLSSSPTSLSSSTNNLSSNTCSLNSNNTNSQSSSAKFDLNSDIPIIYTNESVKKLNSSTKNTNSEPALRSPRSGSSNLKLSISSLNSFSLKKSPRMMHISMSEENVMQNSNDELNSARKYIDALGLVIKDINDMNAPVYNRSLNGFVMKNIDKMKKIDLENSVRKTLVKIKKIADHNLANMEFEKAQSFDEMISLKVQPYERIISHLEEANWSCRLFNKHLHNQLDVNLALTKNAVEEVKNEISALLVGKLFPGELDTHSSSKLTLNDLSFVFPKIISLPQLLSKKVIPLLEQNESELTNQYLLEFCVKCFENKIGLGSNPEVEFKEVVKDICRFANFELKAKLVGAYEGALKYAVEANNVKCLMLKNQEACQAEKIIKEEPSPDLFKVIGFYKFFTKEMEKGKVQQQIVSQIAKSIVKQTALEFSAVPLDELLSGKIDDINNCLFYNHMSASINKLSYVVACEILPYADISNRRKVIFFYLDVIKECIALGDFASAYSLYMGFEGVLAISRLRDTWNMETKNGWDKEMRNRHKYYGEIFDYKDFYKNLFKVMENCQSSYYMIPPALLGSKLNFIEENLSEKVIIQSQLRRLARDVIIPFQKIQKNISNLSENKILITNELLDQKLEILKSSIPDTDTLYNLSLEREPKKT